MSIRSVLFNALLCSILCFTSQLAFGATIHVAPGGSDTTGNGTLLLPFATIQKGVDTAAPTGDTVQIAAGTYAQNVIINKSLSLVGPNAGIDPNTGTRMAEAIVVPAVTETSLQGSTSGAILRLGTAGGPITVTIDGLILDGHNSSFAGGRILNGVEIHTGAGIVNSIGSFDSTANAFNVTMTVRNNIIRNLERYGVLIDNVAARSPKAENLITRNKFDNLPSGNNFGGARGCAVSFVENIYGTCSLNVMTRVNVGFQTINHDAASPGAGVSAANNNIKTYHRGIFHSAQTLAASTAAFTGNTVSVETAGDFSASSTNFGYEFASIGNAVGITATNNSATGTVYGVLLWNLTSINELNLTGGTLTGNQIGIYATTNDPQFGPAPASSAKISGVTVLNSTVAGIKIESIAPSTSALEITGNTSVSGAPVGIQLSGATSSAHIHNNSLAIHSNQIGIDVDGGSATINNNYLRTNTTAIRLTNGGSGAITANNFEGAGLADNGTDVRLDATAGAITAGALTNNTFAGATYIDQRSAQNLTALATVNTFKKSDLVVESDNFALCARIFHKVDSAPSGLVTWVTNNVYVQPATIPSLANNNYTRLANALAGVSSNFTINLKGTFDWTEPNSAASWAQGNDGINGNFNDYSLLIPPNLNDLTITAPQGLGTATIQGPGDLAAIDLECVFNFDRSSVAGINHNSTISNLQIYDFDLSIAYFSSTSGVFNGTQIINNHIRISDDLNLVVAPADALQNIGIHYAAGSNQTIQNNIIDISQSGVSISALGATSSCVGIQCNVGGGAVYNGLLIDGNTINIFGVPTTDPARIIGIWENGQAHSSDITVSNNSFDNNNTGNNSALNLQVAFRVSSHSSTGTTVEYSNNSVSGANLGFQWQAGKNFSGNLPVKLSNNTLTGTATGILIQSAGAALATGNTIYNASIAGVKIQGNSSTTLTSNGFSGGPLNLVDVSIASDSGAVTFSANNFAASQFYIQNLSALPLDASANTFVGISPNLASLPELYRIEDRIHHKVDDSALGLVRVKSAHIFVTDPSGSVNSPSSDSSIDRGIIAAAIDDTVNVEAGTYNQAVTVGTKVKLLGALAGIDPKDHPNTRTGAASVIDLGGANTVLVSAADSLIEGFTIQNTIAATLTLDKSATVRNNVISGATGCGILISFEVSDCVINKNQISSCGVGITFSDFSDRTNITYNSLTQCTYGIDFNGDVDTISVSNNYIRFNTSAGIRFSDDFHSNVSLTQNYIQNGGATAIDSCSFSLISTEHNWWDSNLGPEHFFNGGSGGALITGAGKFGIDFSPWLTDGTDTLGSETGFVPNLFPESGLPYAMYFLSQPTDTVAGAEIPTVQVLVVDDVGNPALNFTGPLFIAINPTSPAGATLGGQTFANVTLGYATFNGLTINQIGNAYKLRVSGENLPITVSAPFSILAKIATNTTLSSAPITSTLGQEVTLTATVTPTSQIVGLPTGTVEFYDGSINGIKLGEAQLVDVLGTPTATFTTRALSIGAHTSLVAKYTGSQSFAVSISADHGHTVTRASTTIIVSSNVTPSSYGQSVTFSATVSPVSPATVLPFGLVTFKDGAALLGAFPLVNGVATLSESLLSTGSHTITAEYSGNIEYTTSTAMLTQIVNAAQTETTLISLNNPAVFGQNLQLSATVIALAPGSGTPSGIVTFKNGSTTLGTGGLFNGVAIFDVNTLAVQLHDLTAEYSATANYAGSISVSLTQFVVQSPSSIVLFSNTNPSRFGETVSLTASVNSSPAGAAIPGGNVTFSNGATILGTGTLDTFGQATLDVSAFTVGAHNLTVVYDGNAEFLASTSAPISQIVNKAQSSSTISSSDLSAVTGQLITFTVTVEATAPGAAIPGGSIMFLNGSDVVGVSLLTTAAGVTTATFTTVLPVGNHAISAYYSGDSNLESSVALGLSQEVLRASTDVLLVSTVNPTVFGQSVTLKAVVGVSIPGAGIPTGEVTFKDGGVELGTAELINGVATVTLALGIDIHELEACYNGSMLYKSSLPAIYLHLVLPANTTVSTSTSLTPAVFGQAVTFSATVSSSAPGAGIPKGIVAFRDGATAIGSAVLDSKGVASLTTAALSTGAHNIIATYAGSTEHNSSLSSGLAQTIVNPTVTISGTHNIATESGTVKGMFTVTRNVVTSLPLTVKILLSGSASEGIDYNTIGGSLTIPAGEASANLTISSIQDSIYEFDETVTLTLQSAATYSLTATTTATATILDDDTIVILSEPVASPNPALVGQEVVFTAASNAPAGIYKWDFGDGTTDTSGSTVKHIYTAVISTVVKLTIMAPGGKEASSQLTMSISANLADIDSDGDGISDEIENLFSTNPADNTSSPATNGLSPLELSLSKMAINVNFTKTGKDNITVIGYVMLPPATKVAGQQMVIDIGGITQSFKLDQKGRGKVSLSSIGMSVIPVTTTGLTKFSARLIGTFSDRLVDEKLTNTTVTNLPISVKVKLVISNKLYQRNQPQFYTAIRALRGSSK